VFNVAYHSKDDQQNSYRYTAYYRKNMMSFTKPEVHNVSQRRWRRTEPRP